MANQFFDSSFRGAGSPGAPGVGSTQRGLQNVQLGEQTLASNQFKLDQQQEQSRLQSIFQGASEIKNISTNEGRRAALVARKLRLETEGKPTQDTEEALASYDAGVAIGNLDEFNEKIDSTVKTGIEQKFLSAPAAKPGFKLGQGQTQFDAAGNQIASVAPKAEKPVKPESKTSIVKNLIAAGMTEGTPEFNAAVLSAVNKPVSTVITKGDTAEEVALAKLRVTKLSDIQDNAISATKLIENLDQLDAIDVSTGAFEPAKASMAAVLEGFGIDASGIANATTAQAFNAVSGRLVNEVLNAATGPQTDQDATRARKTIASLGDTPGAAVFKNASLRAVANRQIEQSDFMNDRLEEGSNLTKANKQWRDFKKKTPSLSAVVKENGLPMFFYQFKERAKQRREGITDDQIITIWRKANGGK